MSEPFLDDGMVALILEVNHGAADALDVNYFFTKKFDQSLTGFQDMLDHVTLPHGNPKFLWGGFWEWAKDRQESGGCRQ